MPHCGADDRGAGARGRSPSHDRRDGDSALARGRRDPLVALRHCRCAPHRQCIRRGQHRIAEARAYYFQGLNYLHGYAWIEGARSFHQAMRLDPELRDGALGTEPHLFRARRSRQGRHEATRAQGARGKRDAARAAAHRLATAAARGDRRSRQRARCIVAYKQAIDKALAADIGDVELWLIRGNAEEPTAAGRGQRGGVASTAFYMEALRVAPDNGAAHHYLTHSYENLNQIDRALEHGEVYARIAADIPHAHHMWGHDLRRVGRIDEAIAAFTRTDELENAYYAAEKICRRARLAPRAQPRPARDRARAQGADAKSRNAAARRPLAVKPITEYQEFNQKSLAVFLHGAAALARGADRGAGLDESEERRDACHRSCVRRACVSGVARSDGRAAGARGRGKPRWKRCPR